MTGDNFILKPVSGPVPHEHGLLLGCFDGDETHGRAGYGFTDGLGIGRALKKPVT